MAEFDVWEEFSVDVDGEEGIEDDEACLWCWSEVEDRVIKCVTEDAIQGRFAVENICRFIAENNSYFKCSYVAQAFLDTLGPEFTHGELYEERFLRTSSELLAVHYVGDEIEQITLLALIEQFFGEEYMFEHYTMTQTSDYIVTDYNDDDSTCVPDEHEQIEDVESDDELPMPAFG